MNVYLETVRKLPSGAILWEGEDYWKPGREFSVEGARARHWMCQRYAWAIPNDAALDAIAKLGQIVEIGAGTGYWAHLLKARGADVIAYDERPVMPATHPGHRNKYHSDAEAGFFDVRKGTSAMAREHPLRALMLCWPPYDDGMAHHALMAYLQAGGDRVVYVGEGYGGCTGDDAFHGLLARHFECAQEIAIPQWFGVHDAVYIYRLAHALR